MVAVFLQHSSHSSTHGRHSPDRVTSNAPRRLQLLFRQRQHRHPRPDRHRPIIRSVSPLPANANPHFPQAPGRARRTLPPNQRKCRRHDRPGGRKRPSHLQQPVLHDHPRLHLRRTGGHQLLRANQSRRSQKRNECPPPKPRRPGHARPIESRIRHKDGHWLTLESTASAVRNAAGNVEKLVIVNRDITERKLLEEQLSLSQKLDAVGRLSGGIAHDFNNLLGVIIGYGEALQLQIPVGDPMREAVDEIQNAGQRAAALTQQLLAFSRKQALEPKVLDLNGVLSDVEKLLRRLIGEDIDLQISLSRYLGRVKADRSQLEQVIVNLAVNARDAMHQGGKLRIETKNTELTEADRERYRYVVPGEYILLTVSDTGCGMDTELQSHIFEPFYTTKDKGKGTGLGLSTVYGVIKQSGGYIWVNSEVGKGTEFKIYLPRAEEVPEENQQ